VFISRIGEGMTPLNDIDSSEKKGLSRPVERASWIDDGDMVEGG
jgi:hypothetical protein